MSSSDEDSAISQEEQEYEQDYEEEYEQGEDNDDQQSMSSDEQQKQRLAEEEAQIKELLKHTSYETLLRLKKEDGKISKFSKKIRKESMTPQSLTKSKSGTDAKKSKSSSSKPKERNARVPVSRFKTIVEAQKPKGRDPRFDGLSGTLNNDLYQKSYSFLVDQKKDEIKTLEQELRKAKSKSKKKYSEEEVSKLRTALGRNKEEMNRFSSNKEKDEVRREHKKSVNERGGDKAFYLKKGEFKKRLLERKFEQLDNSNKLNKVLDRKKKRQSQKIGIELRKMMQKTARQHEKL